MNTILSQISGKDSYDDDAFSSPFNLDDQSNERAK